MKFKKFTLDRFQEDSVQSIEKGNSVIVSAATGTGKTLIAEYLIEKCINEGKRAIYTAPIKALSNQKFRDFKADYGDRVGIMTGDVVINENAQILIMTTEVYRNMLLTRDDLVSEISYIIFDEIHYINDIERGTVWEESIIFSPNWVRFLCLSATIPNARQFADWIAKIKEHTVDVIKYDKRAVPLKHHVFDHELGVTDPEHLREAMELDKYPRYEKAFARHQGKGRRGKRGRSKKMMKCWADQLDLVKEMKRGKLLPCIFFTFSRKDTMRMAEDTSRKFDFLMPEEKHDAIRTFNACIEDSIKNMETVRLVKTFIQKGVGVHNAGLLPSIKLAIEMLFEKGLIKVLYATETFAVGINMPAKAVAFNSMMKYDGISFRNIHTKEYFQMAGRAGRRGLDDIGHVFVLIDRNKMEAENLIKITKGDTEPIVSQFKLSYNTLLNLKRHYNEEQIAKVLRSNFGNFVQSQGKKQNRITSSYNQMVRLLERLGYLEDGFLTVKGEFACNIYANEIAVTELMFSGAFDDLSIKQLGLVIGAISYEAKRADKFKINTRIDDITEIIYRNRFVKKKISRQDLKNLYHLYYGWMDECEFSELLEMCNLEEGHLIRLFRQTIDMLQQIRKAVEDPELKEKFTKCINLIDRDIIAVTF